MLIDLRVCVWSIWYNILDGFLEAKSVDSVWNDDYHKPDWSNIDYNIHSWSMINQNPSLNRIGDYNFLYESYIWL